MRLQKHKTRAYKNREYLKWVVVIPPAIIKLLGWKEGQELEAEPNAGKLLLKKKK